MGKHDGAWANARRLELVYGLEWFRLVHVRPPCGTQDGYSLGGTLKMYFRRSSGWIRVELGTPFRSPPRWREEEGSLQHVEPQRLSFPCLRGRERARGGLRGGLRRLEDLGLQFEACAVFSFRKAVMSG